MADFKINDYVSRTIGGVTFVGRVRKKQEDDDGVRIFVQFTPQSDGDGRDVACPYIEFKPKDLEPVAIYVNPPVGKEMGRD